jgi:hypothetical protein
MTSTVSPTRSSSFAKEENAPPATRLIPTRSPSAGVAQIE